jgi:ABC-type glycerol-3-phosphate transport system substrate-binding protein
LSLADLAKLRTPAGEMPKKFGIAPLPGSRLYFDPDGKAVPVPGRNAVPYLGSGATIGVVFKSSGNPDAAWDLLAETAGLSGSLALLSNDRRGYGPFRTEHTDDGRELTWIEHGLDAGRVRDLVRAMRQHSAANSGNPTFVLRTPDQAALEAALEKEVRESTTGEVPAARALQTAVEAWTAIEAKSSDAEQKKWRRAAAGLQ